MSSPNHFALGFRGSSHQLACSGWIGSGGGVVVEWLSKEEKERIAELMAQGASLRSIRREIPRSRHAVARAIKAVMRPPKREPVRCRLRLSLAEREEISRGLAAGESMRQIADRLGRAASTV